MQDIKNPQNISKKKSLIYALIVILVGTVLGIGGWWYTNQDVIAKVGNKKITQKDLNERIYSLEFKGNVDNPEEIDVKRKKDLLQSLIEWAILDQEAEKYNITVSDKEIEDYTNENTINFDECSSEDQVLIKKGARYNLLKEKVKSELVDEKEGKYIVAHFDRYLGKPTSPEDQEAWEQIPDSDREKRYQEEKVYAEQLMQSIYQDIKDEKISFGEGIEKVNADPKVGSSSFGAQGVIKSESFNQENIEKEEKALFFKEVEEKVSQLSANEISEPFKANVDIGIEESEWKEGLVFIVKIIKGKEGIGGYNSWLSSKKDEYGVKIIKKELASLQNKLFADAAYAAEIGCDSSKWGVNTGRASSSAGLIVHTNIRSVDGSATWPLNDIGIQVEAVDKGGSSGNAILRWGNNPICSSTLENRNTQEDFHTGGRLFMGPMANIKRCNPGSTNNWCGAAAYMVMGWGDSKSQGIGYTLDCDWNYKVSPMVNGPGLGHWELSSITTEVTNGGNTNLTLTWKQDPPAGQSGLECLLYADDPPANTPVEPGRNITYRAVVRNHGNAAASNVIVEIPVPAGTNFVSMTNGCVSNGDCGKVIDSGRSSGSIPTFGAVDHAYWWLSEVPKKGDSYWQWGEFLLTVKVKNNPDVNTITNKAQARKSDNSEIFISPPVNHPVQLAPLHSLDCSELLANPRYGFAPLYVEFRAVATDSDGHALEYEWDFGDGYTDTTSSNKINHIYTTSATYTPKVKVTCTITGESCVPLTTTVVAKSPTQGGGGEISP